MYSSDGEEVGRVEHVLADPEADVFEPEDLGAKLRRAWDLLSGNY